MVCLLYPEAWTDLLELAHVMLRCCHQFSESLSPSSPIDQPQASTEMATAESVQKTGATMLWLVL